MLISGRQKLIEQLRKEPTGSFFPKNQHGVTEGSFHLSWVPLSSPWKSCKWLCRLHLVRWIPLSLRLYSRKMSQQGRARKRNSFSRKEWGGWEGGNESFVVSMVEKGNVFQREVWIPEKAKGPERRHCSWSRPTLIGKLGPSEMDAYQTEELSLRIPWLKSMQRQGVPLLQETQAGWQGSGCLWGICLQDERQAPLQTKLPTLQCPFQNHGLLRSTERRQVTPLLI